MTFTYRLSEGVHFANFKTCKSRFRITGQNRQRLPVFLPKTAFNPSLYMIRDHLHMHVDAKEVDPIHVNFEIHDCKFYFSKFNGVMVTIE